MSTDDGTAGLGATLADAFTELGDVAVFVLTDPTSELSEEARWQLSALLRSCDTRASNLTAAVQVLAGAPELSDDRPADATSEPIEELWLGVRAYNALKNNGYRTIAEVQRLADADKLRALKGLGAVSEFDIRSALTRHNEGGL